jgi:hypothetical protein
MCPILACLGSEYQLRMPPLSALMPPQQIKKLRISVMYILGLDALTKREKIYNNGMVTDKINI